MRLQEFQKVAQMLAKEHKITINEGQGWAANIKGREVYYRKEDIYNLSEEHILGLILHEIAHIHYTTNVALPKENQEITHSTMNMLEDISIEHIISKDYPNAGEILDGTRTECLDVLVGLLPKMTKTSLHEKALLYAATRFQNRGYMFQVEKYEQLGDKISQIMKKHEKEIYNRIQTKDHLPLAKEIVKLLIKEAGEPTQKEKNSMMQDGLPGQANNSTLQEATKGQIIKGLKEGMGWKKGFAANNQIAFIDAISDQSTLIGKQLRSVLKRNNSMEFGGRYRTGKLLSKRFVRVKVIKDRKPFARRIVKSNQSYAFAIASDVSGSMFNSRQTADPGSYALSSMHMVGEALRLANIPRSMIIFGMNTQTVAPMGKSQITWSQLSNSQSVSNTDTGGTEICKAIDECAKQLSKVRAERKIMIVLTDGQSDLSDMQEAHKKATNAGIECLGITIGSRNEARYMNETFSKEKNTQIQDTRNTKLIGQAFIDILKSSIKASPQYD